MSQPEATNPFAEQEWPLEPCAGDTHTDADGGLWTYLFIEYGVKGGRWAYMHIPGYPKRVVIDRFQNMQSANFLGMLSIPWDGLSKLGWVLAKAHCQPVQEKLEPLPAELVRFERLEKPPEED